MRKLVIALIGLAFVIALGVSPSAKVETVKGRLADQACYMKDKANTAMAHKDMSETCAADCAKKGLPVVLVTDDGKVYAVTGDIAANMNAKLVPHMSHVMELTGDVTEAGGKMTINVKADGLKMIGR